MIEIGIQELTYILGSFVTDKLNKAQRKSKKYLESIQVRFDATVSCFFVIFGFYDDDKFKIIDTVKISYSNKGIKN